MNIINYNDLTPEQVAKGCLVLDMPNDDYHKFPAISKSGLDLIARSPAHYYFAEKREPSRAMAIGSAIHSSILEPDIFEKEYVLLKNVNDRRASAYKEAIKHHDESKVLVASECDHIAGMKESIYNNQSASELLSKHRYSEISCFAIDPETKVPVKCRFDTLIIDDLIAVDLKKTQDARIEQFEKSIANYRYHVQDAFYSDVFEWATGKQLNSFQFLAVEEKMPHFSKLYECDTLSKRYGRKLYRENLNTYANCMKNNNWPMPNDGGLEYIGLPAWAADPEESF